MFRCVLAAFFSVIFLSQTYSQKLSENDKENINKRLDQYAQLSAEEDYDKLMDLIYPKLFEFLPKEQMADVFRSMEGMGLDMVFEGMEVTQMEELLEKEKERFALCTYNVKMSVILVSDEMKAPEAAEMMLGSFKLQFGEENVNFSQADNTISVKGEKFLIAIMEEKYGKEWFFVEFDKANPQVLTALLPTDVINKANGITKR